MCHLLAHLRRPITHFLLHGLKCRNPHVCTHESNATHLDPTHYLTHPIFISYLQRKIHIRSSTNIESQLARLIFSTFNRLVCFFFQYLATAVKMVYVVGEKLLEHREAREECDGVWEA